MLRQGLLALADVGKVAEAHVRVYEAMDNGAYGRYLCFERVVQRLDEAIQLENELKIQGLLSEGTSRIISEEIQSNLSNSKLNRLLFAAPHMSCNQWNTNPPFSIYMLWNPSAKAIKNEHEITFLPVQEFNGWLLLDVKSQVWSCLPVRPHGKIHRFPQKMRSHLNNHLHDRWTILNWSKGKRPVGFKAQKVTGKAAQEADLSLYFPLETQFLEHFSHPGNSTFFFLSWQWQTLID